MVSLSNKVACLFPGTAFNSPVLRLYKLLLSPVACIDLVMCLTQVKYFVTEASFGLLMLKSALKVTLVSSLVPRPERLFFTLGVLIELFFLSSVSIKLKCSAFPALNTSVYYAAMTYTSALSYNAILIYGRVQKHKKTANYPHFVDKGEGGSLHVDKKFLYVYIIN